MTDLAQETIQFEIPKDMQAILEKNGANNATKAQAHITPKGFDSCIVVDLYNPDAKILGKITLGYPVNELDSGAVLAALASADQSGSLHFQASH
jgi:hypothetical protein